MSQFVWVSEPGLVELVKFALDTIGEIGKIPQHQQTTRPRRKESGVTRLAGRGAKVEVVRYSA
ncbi:hypothetical protein [Thermogutta sp.]|uniref:hypothetical protein n=1 Tax=Thermogutta sp. TaxID=1962930 RepID=UPI003C7E70B3